MYNDILYSFTVIADAYVTKNAIEDFLSQDHSDFIADLLFYSPNKEKTQKRIDKFLSYLKQELDDINTFLNTEDEYHWTVIGKDKKFFDDNLPKYKRRLEWFQKTDRYPFDHKIFFRK